MRTSDLKVGAPIELVVHGGGASISLISSIKARIDNIILIEKLEHEGKLIGIPDTCITNLLYLPPGEDRPYIWKDISLKAVRYKKEVYHCITRIGSEGRLTNRRRSFRLFIGEEMPMFINNAKGSERHNVILKDISESGMSFVSSEEFPMQKLVRINFEDRNFSMNLQGNIVRIDPQTSTANSAVYGCHFPHPIPALGKYISKRQQEILQVQRS